MRFTLIDRIDAHQPGKFLRGCKFLALGEEYLADHFPRFPVMPGVLMLQCLTEAAAWLWRTTSGFQHSVIVLRVVPDSPADRAGLSSIALVRLADGS